MYENFTMFLLKLPESCKKFVASDCIEFHLPRKHHDCPFCGSPYTYVHDYRKQNLCGFASEIKHIVQELADPVPSSLIAYRHGISTTTVMRHFARATKEGTASESSLSAVISLDEFRGNAGAKFQVVVNDLQHRKCCDIIDDRSAATLYDKIRNYSLTDRVNVELVSIDLSPFFRKLVEECLPNAQIAADKFHAVRLANDALDSIRKEVQAGLDPSQRKWFKNSRRTLLKREHKLTHKEHINLSRMFSFSEKLTRAHALKEEYCRLFDSTDRADFKERLRRFREHVLAAGIVPFRRVLKTLEEWKEEIWNGIRTGYNNGFTEGCNNTIKVLKRVCYGFRNFENFRRRILYMLNNEARQSRRTKAA